MAGSLQLLRIWARTSQTGPSSSTSLCRIPQRLTSSSGLRRPDFGPGNSSKGSHDGGRSVILQARRRTCLAASRSRSTEALRGLLAAWFESRHWYGWVVRLVSPSARGFCHCWTSSSWSHRSTVCTLVQSARHLSRHEPTVSLGHQSSQPRHSASTVESVQMLAAGQSYPQGESRAFHWRQRRLH
jgi:hypothetical protein